MTDYYFQLVKKILNVPCLNEAVQDIIQTNSLDLVSDNWKSKLENNILIQDYCSKTPGTWIYTGATKDYDYYKSTLGTLDVTVVGHCKFIKIENKNKVTEPIPAVLINSEPLTKIACAMTADLGTEIEIDADFKFKFYECSTMNCVDCADTSQNFKKFGYVMNEANEPCIQNTHIYDGQKVINRFITQMEDMFKQSFLAIVQLHINNERYNFKRIETPNGPKIYRITGKIANIIAFNELKLTSYRKPIDVGTLVPFEKTKTIPPETRSLKKEGEEVEENEIKPFLHDNDDDDDDKEEQNDPLLDSAVKPSTSAAGLFTPKESGNDDFLFVKRVADSGSKRQKISKEEEESKINEFLQS